LFEFRRNGGVRCWFIAIYDFFKEIMKLSVVYIFGKNTKI
jgi:hypothetical protein